MKYFLILTLCSIGAFVAVLRTRPELFSDVYLFPNPSAKGIVTVPAPIVPEKKNTKVAGRSRSVGAETAVVSNPVTPPERKPDTTQNTNAGGAGFVEAMVTADTLPIFATNSSKSRVVMVLNKGDMVQTDLLVIDSLGHWSLVKVPGQRISGYVRTEDIDRTRTASNN